MRLYTLDGKCNISGERIKSARAKAKLTQDQLAARLQVAGLQMGQMAISRIESGKRLVPDFELPIIKCIDRLVTRHRKRMTTSV